MKSEQTPSDNCDSKSARRVIAVVTSFRPEPSLIEHCKLLSPQVREIIVVDNGSGEQATAVLKTLASAGVHVERQASNTGIASAINQGFAVAGTFDPEFIITFDQDSRVEPGFVNALVSEFDLLVSRGFRPGMVAPEYFAGLKQSRMPQRRGLIEAYQPIQSGLLMPYSDIKALGPQRDDYFIDSVDTEYYQRAICRGYDSVCAPGLNMDHSLGHMLNVRVLGRFLKNSSGDRRSISVSSPFRYFYRTRNRLVLNREYLRKSPRRREMLRDTFFEALHYAFALYCCRGKWPLLRIMAAGLRAGMRSEMGKIPDSVAVLAPQVSWKHKAEPGKGRV